MVMNTGDGELAVSLRIYHSLQKLFQVEYRAITHATDVTHRSDVPVAGNKRFTGNQWGSTSRRVFRPGNQSQARRPQAFDRWRGFRRP